jgi:hypothetical protein
VATDADDLRRREPGLFQGPAHRRFGRLAARGAEQQVEGRADARAEERPGEHVEGQVGAQVHVGGADQHHDAPRDPAVARPQIGPGHRHHRRRDRGVQGGEREPRGTGQPDARRGEQLGGQRPRTDEAAHGADEEPGEHAGRRDLQPEPDPSQVQRHHGGHRDAGPAAGHGEHLPYHRRRRRDLPDLLEDRHLDGVGAGPARHQ